MSVSATNIDKVSPETIIRNVTVMVGDEELKQGRTMGWYKQQLREALDEVAFKIKMDEQTLDVQVPSNWATTLQMELPSGVADLLEIYMWTGSNFMLEQSARVWFKRRLNNNNGGGTRYTAAISNTNSLVGELVDSMGWLWWDGLQGFPLSYQPPMYANIMNGVLMFSPLCATYNYVRLVYTGTMGDYGEVPCIPRYLVKFVTTYLEMRVYQNMASREPRVGYQGMLDRAKDELYNGRNGEFYAVRKIIKESTQWQRNATNDISERGNW